MVEIEGTRRSTPASGHPHLAIVTDDLTEQGRVVAHRTPDDVNRAYEARVGRGAMLGAAVGFVVATTVITAGGVIAGLGFGASAGIGGFIGAFGGAGFGFMMGATVPLASGIGNPTSGSTTRVR